jgi:peroxiredoxin
MRTADHAINSAGKQRFPTAAAKNAASSAAAGPAFAAGTPLCYRCLPIAAIERSRAERRKSMAQPIRRTPMTIQVGDKVPSATLKYLSPEGPKDITTEELFRGKKVALFAVPGAFTPTCSQRHLPGYVEKAAELKAKGIDQIACVAVNDAFVMGAWGKAQDVGDKVLMLADGSGDFTRAVGLELDLRSRGLGVRSDRYSMLVDNGVVKAFNREKPGQFDVSSAEAMLKAL